MIVVRSNRRSDARNLTFTYQYRKSVRKGNEKVELDAMVRPRIRGYDDLRFVLWSNSRKEGADRLPTGRNIYDEEATWPVTIAVATQLGLASPFARISR